MDSENFEKLAQEALDELPQEFIKRLENIDVTVEDEPNSEMIKDLKLSDRHRLLGIYRGVPRTKRSSHYSMVLPDKITIFRKNIELGCKTTEQVKERIKETIIHEFAHYFGISDERLRQSGVY